MPSLRSADSGAALRLGLLVLLGHLDREPGPLSSVDPVEALAGELPANRAINPQQLLTRLLDHLVDRARLAGDEAQLAAWAT